MKINITSIEELQKYLSENISTYFNATYKNEMLSFENDFYNISICEEK